MRTYSGCPRGGRHLISLRKLTVCDGTVSRRDATEAAAGLAPAAAVLMDRRTDQFFGPYALWGTHRSPSALFAILPGDSLLFTVGLLTAAGVVP
jgi:hypothetical protein